MSDIYGYPKSNGGSNLGGGGGGSAGAQSLYYRGGAARQTMSSAHFTHQRSNDFSEPEDNDHDRDDGEDGEGGGGAGGAGNNSINDIYNRSMNEQTKGWDVFVVTPPDDEDETVNSKWVERFLRILKLVTYIITFVIVLSTAVLSKGIVLFMTSMVRSNRTVPVCSQSIPGLERDKKYLAVFQADDPERIAWIWSLFLIIIVPELMTLFRSVRICTFKSYRIPTKSTFLIVSLSFYIFFNTIIVFISFTTGLSSGDYTHFGIMSSRLSGSSIAGRGQRCYVDQLFVLLASYVGNFLTSIK